MATKALEAYDQAWDITKARFISYGLTGLGTGIGLSAFFFKRRAWPVYLVTGMSLGLAYAQANETYSSLAEAIETKSDSTISEWINNISSNKVKHEWFKRPDV